MNTYCALCPFGLTCQRFGTVWDAGNDVGMMNYIFLYIIICSPYFVIFSLGNFGLTGTQHLVSELMHSSLPGAPNSNAERQATWFAVCAWSARAMDHISEVFRPISSML